MPLCMVGHVAVVPQGDAAEGGVHGRSSVWGMDGTGVLCDLATEVLHSKVLEKERTLAPCCCSPSPGEAGGKKEAAGLCLHCRRKAPCHLRAYGWFLRRGEGLFSMQGPETHYQDRVQKLIIKLSSLPATELKVLHRAGSLSCTAPVFKLYWKKYNQFCSKFYKLLSHN